MKRVKGAIETSFGGLVEFVAISGDSFFRQEVKKFAEGSAECRALTCNFLAEGVGPRALLLFNAEKADIETVSHEVRHALFWICSEGGVFSLNIQDEAVEERFNAEVDALVWRVVCTLEAWFGRRLAYRLNEEGS